MKRLLLLGLVLLLCWCTPVQAQIPVIDAANLVENVVTAVQTVLMVANQVLELTPLDAMALGDTYMEGLDGLAEIIEAAQGLSYDLGSLQAQVSALFSLDTAPDSAEGLRERLAAIRRVVFDSYVYALRTQTLIRTTLSTIEHLRSLVGAISEFVGNMQGNQTLAQADGTLNETLARLQVHTAAYERAQSVDKLAEPVTLEALDRIHDAIMSDYPD
jgi:conjugal transfer/entry exclusion protein